MPEAQAKEADSKVTEKPEEGTKQEKPETETQSPDYETEARKAGWTPKEEFQGDIEKWVDAKEWVSRAPLYDEMKKLRRKSKSLENTVTELKQHYTKVEETAYQRALQSLKQEKLDALESGDHKRVVEVDEEIDRIRNRKPEVTANKVDPGFEQWVDENPWYEKDSDMREYADFVGIRHAKENPEKSPAQVYDYTTRQVKKHFADKFQNPARERPSSVEGGKTTPAKSKRPSWSDLPEVYQKAGDKFVRQGVMTRDQYIDDLVKIGEIKL